MVERICSGPTSVPLGGTKRALPYGWHPPITDAPIAFMDLVDATPPDSRWRHWKPGEQHYYVEGHRVTRGEWRAAVSRLHGIAWPDA